MTLFIQPTITTLKLESDFLLQTQATGGSTGGGAPPIAAGIACGDCDSVGGTLDFIGVFWRDEPGSNVNGYEVSVNVDGTVHNFTNTAPCTIEETTSAGFYRMTCTGLDCSCSNSLELVESQVLSITDPEGNVVTVSPGSQTCDANCNFN